MNLEMIITAVSYSIEIPRKTYTKLEEWELEQPVSACLFDILEKNTEAYDVDYNGHFGPHIFFSVEAESNTKEEWDKIKLFIQQHIVNHLQN